MVAKKEKENWTNGTKGTIMKKSNYCGSYVPKLSKISLFALSTVSLLNEKFFVKITMAVSLVSNILLS